MTRAALPCACVGGFFVVVVLLVARQADQTSQPSLNAFCAAMTGAERDPGIDYLALQPLVRYWAKIREMYRPFESGMLSGACATRVLASSRHHLRAPTSLVCSCFFVTVA